MNLRLLLLSSLFCVPTAAQAADAAEVIKLWPGTPPGPARDVGEEHDSSTDKSNKVAGRRLIRLANVSIPEAHVFLPPKDNRTGAAVVICPGGGYNILALDLEGTEVAEWLNSIGVAAIVVKYRVPTARVDPKWLQPVQDAQRSISITRNRAKEWGINPKRIAALGFSAGGDTATRTAMATKRHYDQVDDADKQSCSADAGILIYPAYLTNKEKTGLVDDLTVTKESPPCFLVHAFDDPVTPESSLFLALALKKAGVASELHMYDAGGHGYGLRYVKDKPVTTWPKACESWLQRNQWIK